MSFPAGVFPSIDDATLDLIATLDVPVGRRTPTEWAGALPFVRVTLIGGNDDGFTDHSAVDVDVFAATVLGAQLLAEQIRTLLLGEPVGAPHVVNGVVIDRYATVTRPRMLPMATPDVFRCSATYRAAARRIF